MNADVTLDPWSRTVAIYRVARKSGARLRARDLLLPAVIDGDTAGRDAILNERLTRWWEDWTRPQLGRLQAIMAAKLQARIAARARAMGFETVDEAARRRPGSVIVDYDGNVIREPYHTTSEPGTSRPEDASDMRN